MRRPIYLLLCVLIVTCSKQKNERISIDDFDDQAKQYFLKNVNVDSIQWLDTTGEMRIERSYHARVVIHYHAQSRYLNR